MACSFCWIYPRQMGPFHYSDNPYNRVCAIAGYGIMFRGRIVELEAVVAVARRRSFRAAAVELGLSATALSQAVAELEARLRVRLFNRTTRSVSTTEAGEQFVSQIAPALSAIGEAADAVNQHRSTPI